MVYCCPLHNCRYQAASSCVSGILLVASLCPHFLFSGHYLEKCRGFVKWWGVAIGLCMVWNRVARSFVLNIRNPGWQIARPVDGCQIPQIVPMPIVKIVRQIRDFVAIVLRVIRHCFQMTLSPFKQCIGQNNRRRISLLYPVLMGFYTMLQYMLEGCA